MPLLAKRLFNYVKAVSNVKDDEKVYSISHTKEQFRSKSEYERRLRLYKSKIWTCRCTGHVNLTHEEAWSSERTVHKTLRAQFPRCYEKPVVAHVHHNTLSLDTLVDQNWLMLQQVLSVGEKIVLKVKTSSKVLKAIVLKVDTTGVQANPTSNCSSPSSDKENADKDENSPKKWVPPKLLPYKYTIRLEDEEKIINSVPGSEIGRGDKPPSKELLRLFIRSHAIRAGQSSSSPWVVDDELVKKYNLESKFASFLLSPTKWRPEEIAKRLDEESQKRKSSSKDQSSPSKKLKLDKSKDKKKKDKKDSTKKEKKSKPLKEIVVVTESSSDDNSSDLNEDSDLDVPLSEMKQVTPKKKSSGSKPSTPSSVKKSSSLESNVLSQHKQVTPKKKSSGSKPSTPSSAKKLKTLKLSDKKSDKREKKSDKKDKKAKKKDRKDKEKDKKSHKKKSPKQGLKQMTLFDLSKKKGMKTPEKAGKLLEKSKKTPEKGKKTPEKGNKSPDKKKKLGSSSTTPPIIQMLMKQLKKDNKDLKKINMLTMKAAQTMSASQRAKLTPEIRALIEKKVEWLDQKKKLASMSVAEKEAYFKKKKLEQKEKMRRMQRMKAQELNKRYEDTELELKPLPPPKLIPTPDGLPNEAFGDVVMITEFIACYAGLLMPEDEYPIYTDALMKALAGGKDGFAYLSRILTILLQTLLQDQISEDYQDIGVPLSDIPINPFTASELVRLCLRKKDASQNEEDEDEEEEDDEEVSDGLIQLLEIKEMYQLEPTQKLQILKGMCLRIMATYSVQDFMEEKQQEASKLWKEKLAQAKEEKKKHGDSVKNQDAEKENKENKTEADASGDAKKEVLEGLSLAHFYGNKSDDKSQPSSDADSAIDVQEGEEGDLASVVKRRRQNAAKAAAEKEKRAEEKRIQKQIDYELYKKGKEKETFEKKFNDGIALAKAVKQLTPIGTDRNHARYWIFNNGTTPGLLIEKGWVGDEMDYSVYSEKEDKDKSNMSSDEESEASENIVKPKSQEEEKTFPHPSQNLWFTYDTVKDLDTLISNLHPQGIREKNLKNELKKKYSDISKAIVSFQRNNRELRDSDGDKEMLEGFRKELLDTELKLRNGGLGGVSDFQTWDTRVSTAEEVRPLAECLLETQEKVLEKFREGSMAPKKKKKPSDVPEVKEEQAAEEDENQEEETEGEKVVKGIADWREAVENATTLSRLHTLLGILDSCIKWEKSAENAKCKICRKKGQDDRLLLCDDCNQAFHMYCLRPALLDIPPGEWFCPACAPTTRRRCTLEQRPGKYRDNVYSSEEEEEEDVVHEENCQECGGDEGLIFCAECPSAYHLECHDPPLRHPPRGRWVCNECKNGVTRRKTRRGRKPGRKKQTRGRPASSRKRKRQDSSSEEESSEEEEEESSQSEESDSDDEEEITKPPPKKMARKTVSSKKGRKTEASKAKAKPEKSKRPGSLDNVYEVQPVVQVSKRAPSELSICEDIVNKMLKHKMAWPFLMAVSKKDVPDYYQIVKQPIDLQKIKDKLNVLVYGSPQEVVDDIALLFRNCAQYNQSESEVFTCMETLEKFFVDLLQQQLPHYVYVRDGAANGYADHMYNQRRSRRSK